MNWTNKNKFLLYVIVGIIAFVYRVYVNFNQELILGVNGGYYPLQVRYILENENLGFSDMPLLFYVDAGLIKLISLFGLPISDALILSVVKCVDCMSIPLLLLALFKIIQFQNRTIPLIFEVALVLLSTFSFSPLILVADLQKNALAVTFLFFFIAHLWQYFQEKKERPMIFALIFLVLTGLTHFGTFVVALVFGLVSIGYIFRKKAIIPLVFATIISILLIGIFDFSRFYRLFTIGSSLFSHPALLSGMIGPPDLLNILFSLGLAILGIKVLRAQRNDIMVYQKGLMFTCIVLLIALSFPFLEGQYFRRLSLFLFVPQVVLLIQLAQQAKTPSFFKISYFLLLMTFVSGVLIMGRPKESVVDEWSFADLKQINNVINKNDKTIIIAKHGLEWWTAWALHTKVGQEKAISEDFYDKYAHVYFLHQAQRNTSEKGRTPFPEPQIPQHSTLIFSSDFFKLYALMPTK